MDTYLFLQIQDLGAGIIDQLRFSLFLLIHQSVSPGKQLFNSYGMGRVIV